MLSRIPPVSRSAPLAVAVFVVGAGLGALAITLAGHSSAKRAVARPLDLSGQARSPDAGTQQAPPRARSEAGGPAEEEGGAIRGQPVVPAAATSSFQALAASLQGEVGLAIAPLGEGPIQTFGSLQAGHAWSTMKVPVLATLLADYEQKGQSLSGEASSDATLALEQSDNAAAEALFGELKQIHGGLVPASEAVQRTLASAGDQSTQINTAPNNQGFTTWGQSIWSASGEVTFYRALARGCLLSGEDTEYVLHLMRSITPSQRWGAGAAGFPSALSLAFKGGWGPENGGYLVRQTAIVGSGERGYVVSMVALPGGGSFEQGVSMITALARWVREHAPLGARQQVPGCVGR